MHESLKKFWNYTFKMKRYPMFDPPEYVNWTPVVSIIDEFEATLRRDPDREKVVSQLTEEQLLDMYAGMLRFRLHDMTLKRWVKQGILSKAWLGTGEEAVTVGTVHALDRKIDKVGPMIRNAGACHEMGIPVADLLREYLATADSPSEGKDLHVGSMAHGVIAPASQVGALTPVFAGIALAFKQRGERAVGLTWIGDGATKTAAFHEGMNLAAVLHYLLFSFSRITRLPSAHPSTGIRPDRSRPGVRHTVSLDSHATATMSSIPMPPPDWRPISPATDAVRQLSSPKFFAWAGCYPR